MKVDESTKVSGGLDVLFRSPQRVALCFSPGQLQGQSERLLREGLWLAVGV